MIILDNPHASHDEPGTVAAKGRDECNLPVQELRIRMKLWENRIWGWVAIDVGKNSSKNNGQKILKLRINSDFCNNGMDTKSSGTGTSIENGKTYEMSTDTSLNDTRPIEINDCP